MRHFWVRISAGLCEHPASTPGPGPVPGLVALTSRPHPSPKVARNLGTLTFLSIQENVAIPTITIQIMK